MQLILRSVFFTITLPGLGIIGIPYLIIRVSGPVTIQGISPALIFTIFLWLISVGVLLYCIWSFAWYGRGTLAPVVPPKHLVVQGIYRYTRNPMYLAVFAALLIESLIFSNLGIFVYAVFAFILFHLFVVGYEEPKLRDQFGASYVEYQTAVPRWGITLRPYSLNNGT
jgi:protein-S-isoprenylcysteine O-methyltransferase Ste14